MLLILDRIYLVSNWKRYLKYLCLYHFVALRTILHTEFFSNKTSCFDIYFCNLAQQSLSHPTTPPSNTHNVWWVKNTILFIYLHRSMGECQSEIQMADYINGSKLYDKQHMDKRNTIRIKFNKIHKNKFIKVHSNEKCAD